MNPEYRDYAEVDLHRRTFLVRLNRVLGICLSVPLVYPLIRFIRHGMYPGLDNTWVSLGRLEDFREYDRPRRVSLTRLKRDAYRLQKVEKSHWVVRGSPGLLREVYRDGKLPFRDEAGNVLWENTPDVEFVVFSGKCPHLGCAYRWREGKGIFFCPCHVSIFRRDGKVISGPSPRQLDRLPVRIREGHLEIIDAEFKAGKRMTVRLV